MMERTLSQKVMQFIESKGKIDIRDIAAHLQVDEADVSSVIHDLTDKIEDTISPYSQIELSELSKELGFSYDILLIFLKILIKNGGLQARLDMVQKSLVIPLQTPSTDSHEIDFQKLRSQRDLLVMERGRKRQERQKANELKQHAEISGALRTLSGDLADTSPVLITAASLKKSGCNS